MEIPVLLFDLVKTEPGQPPENIVTYINEAARDELAALVEKHLRRGFILLDVPGTLVTVQQRSATVNDQSAIPADSTAHAKSQGYVIDDAAVDAALEAQSRAIP